MWRDLSAWAKSQGWNCEPQRLSGVYRSYRYTVSDYDGTYFTVATAVPALSDEGRERLARFFAAQKRALHILRYDLNGSLLSVRLYGGNAKVLSAFIDALSSELAAGGVLDSRHCGICGSPDAQREVWLGDVRQLICDQCHQSVSEQVAVAAQADAAPRNYGPGAVGAILGALVGAIPWVIVDQLGFIASILGMIIGSAAMTGYRKFGGRVGRATAWIIGLSTFIGVVAADAVSIAIFFRRNDILVSAHNYVIMFTHPDVAGLAWRDLLIGLAMAAWGVWRIIRNLARAGRPASVLSDASNASSASGAQ